MIKKEKNLFKDNIVLDTGPLIDYLCNTGVVEFVQNEVIDNPKIKNIIISPITLTEIFYILCRQKGEIFAKDSIDLLRAAVKVELEFKIREIAGKYKCERAISLADCYTLATAKLNSATALFKKEEEIDNELKNEPFDLDLKIIE